MALGFDNKKPDTTGTSNFTETAMASHDGLDVEKQPGKGRMGSRIGAPIPGIPLDSDDDVSVSVGKQMELEASNDIKYRSCSWQKVLHLFSFTSPLSTIYYYPRAFVFCIRHM